MDEPKSYTCILHLSPCQQRTLPRGPHISLGVGKNLIGTLRVLKPVQKVLERRLLMRLAEDTSNVRFNQKSYHLVLVLVYESKLAHYKPCILQDVPVNEIPGSIRQHFKSFIILTENAA